MAVNLIVAAVTLLMAGFVTAWAIFPPLRGWLETPKNQFLAHAQRFPGVTRDEANQPPAPTH